MTDFYRDKTVLITGISGFLGAHLARALTQQGARVVGFDVALTSPCLRVHRLDPVIVPVDLTHHGRTMAELLKLAPDYVFHLAGASHIAWCQQNPLAAVQANIVATANLLEACRAARDQGQGPKGIVVSSSNHVYAGGTHGRLDAYHEADALEAVDLYGMTKGAADALARTYAASYGLPVVALRHVNAYGPADPHASHIVTATILSLLAGKSPIIKSDGTPTKGYIFVDDVVSAYRHAGQLANVRPGAYNVGRRDMAVSVRQLVQTIIGVSGRNAEATVTGDDLSQSGYVERLDDALFRRSTGWCHGTGLAPGLRATWEWYVEHGGMAWLA